MRQTANALRCQTGGGNMPMASGRLVLPWLFTSAHVGQGGEPGSFWLLLARHTHNPIPPPSRPDPEHTWFARRPRPIR